MPASHTNVQFVDAYDKDTGQKVSVPPHFLEKDSPFPNLTEPPSSSAKTGFDPAEHNVADVTAHLDGADEAEVARTLDAEAAGKNRAGVINHQSTSAQSGAPEGDN